jgi:predicted dehydrogenase
LMQAGEPARRTGREGDSGKLRVAVAGTGFRGVTTWGIELLSSCGDLIELTGLCDANGCRVEEARRLIGVACPIFTDLGRMLHSVRPDLLIVSSPDWCHAEEVVQALERDVEVLVEKPLCVNEEQCRAILQAQRKSRAGVRLAFNARHLMEARKIKEWLLAGAIGRVLSVEYQELLDRRHGASYFRRWHRLRKNSGTLLVHKASHHFDQVNWWLEAEPVEVTARGELLFYGPNNPFSGSHCRECPHTGECAFYWDILQDEWAKRLYSDCEREDGYLRDGCVWSGEIDIYDTMSAVVRYDCGALLSYTALAYSPFEGQVISINGTKGRIDLQFLSGPGEGVRELRLNRVGEVETVNVPLPLSPGGGHRGADASLQRLLFDSGLPDPLGLRAGLEAGIWASLVGIAACRSVEEKRIIRVDSLRR